MIFRDNPVFGVGAGGFGVAFRDEYQFLVDLDVIYSTLRSAHSTVLRLLSEHGLIGVALWLWFLVRWYRTAIGNKPMALTNFFSEDRFSCFCLGTIIVSVAVSFPTEFDRHKMYWLLVGLGTVWSNLAPRLDDSTVTPELVEGQNIDAELNNPRPASV